MDDLNMENINDVSLVLDDDTSQDTGDTSVDLNTLSLDELNGHLGKEFPTKEAALKSLKDTFGYVGKVGQLEKKVKELEDKPGDYASASELKDLKNELFFSKNPEYEQYRDVIAKMGDNPADVVSSDTFKGIFEKARGFDEVQKTKTVLQSNPRLAQAISKTDELKSLVSSNKTDEARDLAARIAIDAFAQE